MIFSFQVENKALLQSAFRLHFKIEPSEKTKIKHIFLKATTNHMPQFKLLAEIFPQFVLTFNTRHPIPSMRSSMQVGDAVFHSLFWRMGIMWRGLLNGKYSFYLEPEFDKHLQPYNFWYRNMNFDELILRIYCRMVMSYFLHKNIYRKVILYENLSQNPSKELKELFALLNVDDHKVDLALEALDHDSQNSTFGTRGKTQNYEFTQEFWKNINPILMEYNLPFKRDTTEEDFIKCFNGC